MSDCQLSFPIVAEFSLCLVKCILVSQTLSHRIEFVLIMPFIQSGPHATAHITTYNDVAGNQINSTRNITTGNITAGKGGDGGNTESAAGYSAGGSGGPGGSGGSVNIS